ncbi:hypothetical protein [Alteripontixanthobacter maritimus]|uniref:hypothetical protein n=1 Tax=Alteripontixanthobacter maritimus TaxID=2161824 RepID=UPI000E1B5844|nr:hypothetical protein [Alteripontixanthobacter maritimus]
MISTSIEVGNFLESFGQFGVELLTTDGKIILYLHENGPTRVKELMLASKSSYRGFYLAFERLKEKDIISAVTDSKDRRVRVVQLIKTIV